MGTNRPFNSSKVDAASTLVQKLLALNFASLEACVKTIFPPPAAVGSRNVNAKGWIRLYSLVSEGIVTPTYRKEEKDCPPLLRAPRFSILIFSRKKSRFWKLIPQFRRLSIPKDAGGRAPAGKYCVHVPPFSTRVVKTFSRIVVSFPSSLISIPSLPPPFPLLAFCRPVSASSIRLLRTEFISRILRETFNLCRPIPSPGIAGLER